ncbi:MAG: hypothetical protein RR837_11785 [Bacteroidales bacterium]
MKTIIFPLPVLRKTISFPKISFWLPLTNVINQVTDEKFTITDTKKIVAGCIMLLLITNIYAWPLALFPGIYLMKGDKK